VAAAVAGEIIVFTALHELEMVTAMQLKLFRREGNAEQAAAALDLVHEDLAAGKLVEAAVDWRTVFREAARSAQAHAARVGCRSLDILHCTLAQAADATVFLSSDTRQIMLARAEGLRVLSV
jgi:hypothetical protein